MSLIPSDPMKKYFLRIEVDGGSAEVDRHLRLIWGPAKSRGDSPHIIISVPTALRYS